ncbi:ASCH domain-containing protein [Paenibacillus methanolicus]|uniref:ASCH domain-containing protein n=1 Tax=Paenibacillus methanolicus TaxID=582686 RepID=A0A5S5CHP9_9BACL|nr:ASCH domain-containing protein [Paenibacillus methanolicus]TYP79252.1 hypothetical protein BCM02_101370 [Paenibacillus methanolicus]
MSPTNPANANERELGPKTCAIERLVTRPDDIALVLSGRKTATRRNGRYADPGETMELGGARFVVDRVYRQSIGELTEPDAVSEGFDSLAQYEAHIRSMHPGMPWLPNMKMWVHEFRRLDDELPAL